MCFDSYFYADIVFSLTEICLLRIIADTQNKQESMSWMLRIKLKYVAFGVLLLFFVVIGYIGFFFFDDADEEHHYRTSNEKNVGEVVEDIPDMEEEGNFYEGREDRLSELDGIQVNCLFCFVDPLIIISC